MVFAKWSEQNHKTSYHYSHSLGQGELPTQPWHLIELDQCHK